MASRTTCTWSLFFEPTKAVLSFVARAQRLVETQKRRCAFLCVKGLILYKLPLALKRFLPYKRRPSGFAGVLCSKLSVKAMRKDNQNIGWMYGVLRCVSK